MEPGSGDTQVIEAPDLVGAVALAQEGGLLVALRHGIALYEIDAGFRELARFGADGSVMRSNDARCDRQGRFWLGTLNDGARVPDGALYCYNGRDVAQVLDGITIPNCLAWSPDGRTMYFADSWTERVMAYAFDPDDGIAHSPRVFLEQGRLPGIPDGATVDESGCLWHARYGAGLVARVSPKGEVEAAVELPVAQVTSCALGGADLRTLYVTSARQRMDEAALLREPAAGSLFAVAVPTAGLREPEFRGAAP